MTKKIIQYDDNATDPAVLKYVQTWDGTDYTGSTNSGTAKQWDMDNTAEAADCNACKAKIGPNADIVSPK